MPPTLRRRPDASCTFAMGECSASTPAHTRRERGGVPLFRSFILRRLATERLRSALTISGVALGIAVVVAIRLANESSVSGFAAALDAMTGAASLEIVGPAAGLDELRLADLGWLERFGPVSPVI